MGEIYWFQGDTETAINANRKAVNLAELNSCTILKPHFDIADLFLEIMQYDSALAYLYRANQLVKGEYDSRPAYIAYTRSRIKISQGEFAEALDYSKYALSIYDSINAFNGLMMIMKFLKLF